VIGERPLIADSSAQANRAPMPPAAACQILLTCLSVCNSGACSRSANHTAIMPIVKPISPARAIPTRPSAKAKSHPVASAPPAAKKPLPRARSPTAAQPTPTSSAATTRSGPPGRVIPIRPSASAKAKSTQKPLPRARSSPAAPPTPLPPPSQSQPPAQPSSRAPSGSFTQRSSKPAPASTSSGPPPQPNSQPVLLPPSPAARYHSSKAEE
jgi:hypothetical protein